jgi:hypothetical protein
VTGDDDGHVARTRAALVGFLRQQAEWRLWKAEEDPWDLRNTRSADALVEVAGHVERLDVRDERLRRLAMVHADDGEVLAPGEEAARLAGHCGFDQREDPDAWLTTFVQAVVEESLQHADEEQDWL